MNDQITLFPSEISGSISAPPSKSESHRAIISAALSNGTSIIRNVILSDDIRATIRAVEAFGTKTTYENQVLTIHGSGELPKSSQAIDCHESGSTLRFMIPIYALTNHKTTFVGQPSLMARPLNVYQDIFKREGFIFDQNQQRLTIKASLKPKKYTIPGNISSQFITGLLFVLPLLNADSEIEIIGEFESKSYVSLTLDVLNRFGISIQTRGHGYYIKGNQQYHSQDYTVSGDYSQAAYFLVAGTFSHQLSITNLRHDSIQGDREMIQILKNAHATITEIDNGFIVQKSHLIGQVINIENCPDLGPIVALMCSLSKGKSIITGASRLRIKESDRIESTVQVLQTLGAKIHTEGDDIHIEGVTSLNGGIIDSHNDHRIAMMASIASLASNSNITITRPWAINKSYPHFYQDLESLGVVIKKGDAYENNPCSD